MPTTHPSMPRIDTVSIIVRDVVHNARHEFPGTRAMLRVPYDLFSPRGPAHFHDHTVTYEQGNTVRVGRTAPAPLADARPGERVLIRLSHDEADDRWWLCEIEEVVD